MRGFFVLSFEKSVRSAQRIRHLIASNSLSKSPALQIWEYEISSHCDKPIDPPLRVDWVAHGKRQSGTAMELQVL
jgi:hypothetical protein